MGLTKRKDSYYVEFPVLDDGKVLKLARGVPGAKLKRWKVGTTNRTIAKQQEALIKTELMKGLMKSDHVVGPITFKTLADAYLASPGIQRQVVYNWKVQVVRGRLVPLFGDRLITTVTPAMIEDYRAARRKDPGYNGVCVKVATINRDLSLLKHLFSYALRENWLERNPVRHVKLEKENNARDRVLSPEEFEKLNPTPPLTFKRLMPWRITPECGEGRSLTSRGIAPTLKPGLFASRLKTQRQTMPELFPLPPT